MSDSKPYVALPVAADDETLWTDHFGEAPRYHLFDRQGQLVETRDNPHAHTEHTAHSGPKRIVDLLPECGVFIAYRMGSGRKNLPDKHGVKPVITTHTTVQSALQAYLTALLDEG